MKMSHLYSRKNSHEKPQQSLTPYAQKMERVSSAEEFSPKIPFFPYWRVPTKKIISTTKAHTWKEYKEFFKKKSKNYSLCHFLLDIEQTNPIVKELDLFRKQYKPNKEKFSAYCNRTENYELVIFFMNLKKFPFYKQLRHHLKRRKRFLLTPDERKRFIVNLLITHPSFNYFYNPMTLFPIHQGKNKKNICAVEEQVMFFGQRKDKFKQAQLHFLIPHAIHTAFRKKIEDILTENPFLQATDLNISYNLADQTPPSLLAEKKHSQEIKEFSRECLNSLFTIDEDIIHISTIDDIEVPAYQQRRHELQKGLQGKLMELLEKRKHLLHSLKNYPLNPSQIKKILHWCKEEFLTTPPPIEQQSLTQQRKALIHYLSKPVRVCAVNQLKEINRNLPYLEKDNEGKLSKCFMNKKKYNLYYTYLNNHPQDIEYICSSQMCCSIKNEKNQKYDLEELMNLITPQETTDGLNNEKFWMEYIPWNTSLIEAKQAQHCSITHLNDFLHRVHQPTQLPTDNP